MIVGLVTHDSGVDAISAEGRDLGDVVTQGADLESAVGEIVRDFAPVAFAVVVDDYLDADGRDAVVAGLRDVAAPARVVTVPESMARVHAGDGALAAGAAKVTASAGWSASAESRSVPTAPEAREREPVTVATSGTRSFGWPAVLAVLVVVVLLVVLATAL